ncbi:diguanylate cyclase [Colwellia psychrerythraea]|uniref:diguanylate cyclase n=1 Tax=Colwellia psychrerythraea TaxID=28229 RepID=A0A099L4X3_COLPS|nr:diguanylate cyclase [Colwellia psychrerythraea]KGJ97480.1 diguanylate cyclase [Colwellia psychrerythraea]
MKAWFTTYLQLDKDIESNFYRKKVTSKFILLLSFIILSTLMIGNFIYSNTAIFYVNLCLFITMSVILFLPGKLRKYASHIVLHFMGLGVLLVVYFNHGREYTPIWYFLYIFLVMSLYGHKVGLRISLAFLTILLIELFSFTSSTVTMMEFVRFTMVACFTLFFAYLAEMLISRTFEKLITAKSQLEKLTKTDALTGLFNRRHFDEVLPQQMSRANRSHELLALAIIDIDHFKSYNDTFGHPAGDVALVALANLLKVQMKRGNDAVFRLGGEEFALLYQAKNEQSALILIEDIRVAVESLQQYCELEKKITISAGLLLIDSQQNISVESAYELADKLLYQAKNSGRNKVVISK